jgi:CubicO group peptidase (beta-lactamase class C family)
MPAGRADVIGPMKKLKKTLFWIVGVFAVISVVLLVTGKFYYWKALAYNYVDIDDLDLFAHRTVEAPAGVDWPVAKGYNTKPLSPALLQELEAFESVAFLVIRDDSIQYERYWDGYSDSSLSNSFSMAKSFISALVGIAMQEGYIRSLDDPVMNYLPEFRCEANAPLTIRHLLTMSSGLSWDEQYSSLTSQTTEAYYGSRIDRQMMRLRVVRTPGKEYEYMSCNTQLLGMVLYRATGLHVADYAAAKLWAPMHAVHAAEWSLGRPGGMEKAYCCYYSNARDFARIGKLYLDSGRWDGRQLVPEAYVLESVRPAPLVEKGKPVGFYGLHWWLDRVDGRPLFYARGILGQYVIVVPEERILIVRLGHRRDKGDDGQLRDVPLYVHEVLGQYGRHAAGN